LWEERREFTSSYFVRLLSDEVWKGEHVVVQNDVERLDECQMRLPLLSGKGGREGKAKISGGLMLASGRTIREGQNIGRKQRQSEVRTRRGAGNSSDLEGGV